MKLKDNALSLIKQMLDNPEKDWSNDLPLIEFTEGDYVFSKSIINRRIADPKRREDALKWLDDFKGGWKHNSRALQNHSDFYRRLLDQLTFKKRYETENLIKKEVEEYFPYCDRWGGSDKLYDEVHHMFSLRETSKSFKKQFNDQVAKLKQLNFEEEISRLKELGLEIGEGN